MPYERLKKFIRKSTRSRSTNDWRTGISKADLTREEFCLLCANALRDLFKDATIEQGASYDELTVTRKVGKPITVFLENIWRETRNQPDVRVERVERFLRLLVETAAEQSPTSKSCIVPMIKDEVYLQTRNGNAVTFMTEHFAGDLWIVYAIDKPESMSTLAKTEAISMGLQLSDLRPLAIENLRRILPPIMQHGEGPLFMLTAGADYVASLLLFDDVWTEIQETIEGDIVAAVPSRDVLFFTDSTSKEGIEAMRSSITRVINSGGYLVSSTMFRRTAAGWKTFS
jgi:uncharacterized protein YtpQ (UPF0354 family)